VITVIGIDPGWSGAISIYKDGECIGIDDTPKTIKQLIAYVEGINYSGEERDFYACLEQIHAFPGFDLASQENLIRNHQVWVTLLEIHAKDFIQVSPVLWQNKILGKIDHSYSDTLVQAEKMTAIMTLREVDKKEMDRIKKIRKKETKDASITKAKSLYADGIYEIVGPKGGVSRLHDRADAVCIGKYGCDHFKPELIGD
jgi:hypothetical protein